MTKCYVFFQSTQNDCISMYFYMRVIAPTVYFYRGWEHWRYVTALSQCRSDSNYSFFPTNWADIFHLGSIQKAARHFNESKAEVFPEMRTACDILGGGLNLVLPNFHVFKMLIINGRNFFFGFWNIFKLFESEKMEFSEWKKFVIL